MPFSQHPDDISADRFHPADAQVLVRRLRGVHMGSYDQIVLLDSSGCSSSVPRVATVIEEVAGNVEQLASDTADPSVRRRVDTPASGEIEVTKPRYSDSIRIIGRFDEELVLPMAGYAIAAFEAMDLEYAVVGDCDHEQFERSPTVEQVLKFGNLQLISKQIVDDIGREILRRAPVCALDDRSDGSIYLYDPPVVPRETRLTALDAVAGEFDASVDAAGRGVREGCRETSSEFATQLDALDGWNPVLAAKILARDGEAAVEWLADGLNADSPHVEASALRTLSLLRHGSGIGEFHVAKKRVAESRGYNRDKAILAAGRAVGHPGLNVPPTPIVDRLTHSRPEVRAAAAWCLTGPEALAHREKVLELRADDERVRAGLVVALAKARGFEELSAEDLLREDDAWIVRATAAWALGVYRSHRTAIRPLGVALKDDPHPYVRAAAADALETYAGVYDVSREKLGTVARRVFETDSDERVVAAALRMGKYGLTVEDIACLAVDSGWIVAREVARTLSGGARTVRRNDEADADQFRTNVRAAVDTLVQLLDHDRKDVRKAARNCLTVGMTRDLAIELASYLDTDSEIQRRGIARAVSSAWGVERPAAW
jgi:hypothetical protein